MKWARQKAGFRSARAAALESEWKESTYRAHESGNRKLSEKDARKYARRFRVPWLWLLYGNTVSSPERTVRLAGYVGAGAEVLPVGDSDGGDDIELPPGAPPDAGAVIVRGDSMYPRYLDGEVLFYSTDGLPPDALIGKECVVRLSDGRMLVKTVRKGSRKNRYTLESYNAPPLENQEIDWAAPIKWRG